MKNTSLSNKKMRRRLLHYTPFYSLSMIVVIFGLACVACNKPQPVAGNKELQTQIFKLDALSNDSSGVEGEILSVDAEFVGTKGSVFIVRGRYLTDTAYMFWALLKDSTTWTTWAFGGPWWGRVDGRYVRLLQQDSLFLLLGLRDKWRVDSIWDAAVSDRVSGYPTIKATQREDGTLELQ